MQKEKLGQVLQIITKMLQDLKPKKNMVKQAKSNIKNLDKKITEAQNLFIHFPNISHTISAAATAAAVQAQTLQISTVQALN